MQPETSNVLRFAPEQTARIKLVVRLEPGIRILTARDFYIRRDEVKTLCMTSLKAEEITRSRLLKGMQWHATLHIPRAGALIAQFFFTPERHGLAAEMTTQPTINGSTVDAKAMVRHLFGPSAWERLNAATASSENS